MASIILLLFVFPVLSHAATFNIFNNCPYTVWAAAVPGGGQQLNPGQSWAVNAPGGTTGGRVWGRTGCNFGPNGQGHCNTGDCGGALHCTGYGSPPNTPAEYALGQFQNLDFYYISLVDGFNVPMDFAPTSACHDIRCSADIVGQCPGPLRVTGGCNNPCTTFRTDNYCCTGSAAGNCGPTGYSMFFKNLCRDSYSYPKDDQTSTFTCPTGTNYRVTFCP